jgi:dTDP-4-dehydrorhamnose 3,5-epimerase
VLLIEPDVYRDERGFFLETYHAEKYRGLGIPGPFVQDNHSRSVKGTLRGIHLQVRRPQGKLVRVIEGEVYDIAVDVRRGSPTFGRWVGMTLSAENYRQSYVPPGFGHGFAVLSPVAQVEYKCTELYDPGHEVGIVWNDPQIGIDWQIVDPLLSARDRDHPRLADQLDRLPQY